MSRWTTNETSSSRMGRRCSTAARASGIANIPMGIIFTIASHGTKVGGSDEAVSTVLVTPQNSPSRQKQPQVTLSNRPGTAQRMRSNCSLSRWAKRAGSTCAGGVMLKKGEQIRQTKPVSRGATRRAFEMPTCTELVAV
eukprot:scaffold336131_cov16-Prasinocladus_malaysianus.AAC.1